MVLLFLFHVLDCNAIFANQDLLPTLRPGNFDLHTKMPGSAPAWAVVHKCPVCADLLLVGRWSECLCRRLVTWQAWVYIYQSIVSRCPDLVTIFYEIDVVNFGRAMAYLTWDEIRVAVQLVAKRLRGFDFAKFKIEESFFDKIMPIFQRLFSS